MSETSWSGLEEDKRNKLPTPPVGLCVQWFEGGDRRRVFAARVIAIEVPGRVHLEVKAPGKIPVEKKGVYHVSYRIHKVHGNQNTSNCGSWDYLPGYSMTKRDYAFHEEELEKREMTLMAQEEKNRADAAARASAVGVE